MIGETHDPELKSWVESANHPGCDFPIQNLPLGVFRTQDDLSPRLGVAIGDFILDARPWLAGDSLNGYMSLPATQRRDLRRTLSKALAKGSPARDLIPQSDTQMLLPAHIGDYSDFYASIHHATNVGRMFRPDNPLLPNYKHVPIAYHGRASSIVVSGTPVRRPLGQLGEGRFGPSNELDYELEIGAFLGPGNSLGESIPIAEAEQMFIALKDLGVETVFLRYPREGHGLTETRHQIDATDRSIAWYEKHFANQGGPNSNNVQP